MGFRQNKEILFLNGTWGRLPRGLLAPVFFVAPTFLEDRAIRRGLSWCIHQKRGEGGMESPGPGSVTRGSQLKGCWRLKRREMKKKKKNDLGSLTADSNQSRDHPGWVRKREAWNFKDGKSGRREGWGKTARIDSNRIGGGPYTHGGKIPHRPGLIFQARVP